MEVIDYSIEVDYGILPWRLFVPDDSNKDFCVIWLQGWLTPMDSHHDSVRRMSQLSNTVFATIDYAGHGKSPVKLDDSTRKQQFDDLVRVYDELVSFGYKHIIVNGGSFGAYLAAILLSKREVYSAVLRAPAIYPDNEFEVPYINTFRYKIPSIGHKQKAVNEYIDNNMAINSISKFTGTTYILEHELDEIVPKTVPKAYFNSSRRSSYILVPHTTHALKKNTNPQAHYRYEEDLVIAITNSIKSEGLLVA